ncbi:MAG: hypothetical protein KJO07_12965, partial [Deltaproteobacteria bacterium]|nr:hypothetical protein [Deltaproteobacteria bacterium]
MVEKYYAGVGCFEVLAELSSFAEGSLAPERTETLRQHVERCSVCERFGREFETVVEALRNSSPPGALPVAVRERLERALH